MAYYLNRRDNVPGWEVASVMLFIMFGEVFYLLTWATIGFIVSRNSLPAVFGLIPVIALGAAVLLAALALYLGASERASRLADLRAELSRTSTVLAAEAAGPLAEPRVGLWLGSGANVVHYPVRAGKEIAIVVIARQTDAAGGWDNRIEAERVLAVERGRDRGHAPWRKARLGVDQPAPHPVEITGQAADAMGVDAAQVGADQARGHSGGVLRRQAVCEEKRAHEHIGVLGLHIDTLGGGLRRMHGTSR